MLRLKLFSIILIVAVNCVVGTPKWYTASDGRKYYIEVDDNYNWLEAGNICARNNLQLVVIDTEDKNTALIALLIDVFGQKRYNLWLGATDQFNTKDTVKRPFYWAPTGQPMDFTHWPKAQPDNMGKREHCVHIWKRHSDFKWNDVHCTVRFGFICEVKSGCDADSKDITPSSAVV